MNKAVGKYAPKGRSELAQQVSQTVASKKVSFVAGGATVELSVKTVRDYLVTGNKDRISEQEIVMFINLCKFAGLNPWLREAYCIKYGSEPATMVVGKGAFEKRADANPLYDGLKAGIITLDEETGVQTYREGSFYLPGEAIVGGWAEVFRKDRSHSSRVEVPFDEYVGRKSDGTINGQWAKKPATMIRKVAVVQALREAFPGAFTGMYDAAEMPNVNEDDLVEGTIVQPAAQQQSASSAPVQQPEEAELPDAPEQEEQVSLNDL